MKIKLCYPVPNETPQIWQTFLPFVRRFKATLLKFDPGEKYELIAIHTGPFHEVRDELDELPVRCLHYPGQGWDIGADQHANRFLVQTGHSDAFTVNFTSRCYFHRPGWLARLAEERANHGRGIYGISASNQFRPHICARTYGIDAADYVRYPVIIQSRLLGAYFECGTKSLLNWADENYLPAWVVSFDGIRSREHWIDYKNGFRNGNQSEMLVWDKHSDIYANASQRDRFELERLTKGGI